jgi:hypothetical protein
VGSSPARVLPPSVPVVSADVPAGVRFTRDVGPGDEGVRVSLRHALPEGGFADVLGVVRRWSDGVVEVERRDGSVAVVDESAVVAAKRVPPPPERPR